MMSGSTCALCSSAIFDRYILKVRDTLFHQACLFCCVCQMPLTHTCFYRDNTFFCKSHYDKTYRMKCSRCQSLLFPHDLVMRGPECSVFHVNCFNCSVCGYHFRIGDEYVHNVRDGNHELVCSLHFGSPNAVLAINTAGHVGKANKNDEEGSCKDNKDNADNVANANTDNGGAAGNKEGNIATGLRPFVDVESVSKMASASASASTTTTTTTRDGRRGPKRPRTILTAMQRRQFKASFEVSPKPCRKVWFQNQRAKMKKMQRRGNGTNVGNDNDNENSNSANGSNGASRRSKSGGHGGGGGGGAAANPDPKMVSEPEESMGSDECSSDDEVASFDMTSDELAMDMSHPTNTYTPVHMSSGSPMSTVAAAAVPPPPPPPPQLPVSLAGPATLMAGNACNPIDKLYHMQDSFFTQ